LQACGVAFYAAGVRFIPPHRLAGAALCGGPESNKAGN